MSSQLYRRTGSPPIPSPKSGGSAGRGADPEAANFSSPALFRLRGVILEASSWGSSLSSCTPQLAGLQGITFRLRGGWVGACSFKPSAELIGLNLKPGGDPPYPHSRRVLVHPPTQPRHPSAFKGTSRGSPGGGEGTAAHPACIPPPPAWRSSSPQASSCPRSQLRSDCRTATGLRALAWIRLCRGEPEVNGLRPGHPARVRRVASGCAPRGAGKEEARSAPRRARTCVLARAWSPRRSGPKFRGSKLGAPGGHLQLLRALQDVLREKGWTNISKRLKKPSPQLHKSTVSSTTKLSQLPYTF